MFMPLSSMVEMGIKIFSLKTGLRLRWGEFDLFVSIIRVLDYVMRSVTTKGCVGKCWMMSCRLLVKYLVPLKVLWEVLFSC